ncbi:uncharacterized protein LOC117383558 [Periophthalmus magnuspinnatus]|uniref:uncharacterized protein LOC117383558 n=1 Tax=Periophthalmus magnuspinnatus TaxID=409849 RepID=UPI0024366D4C|nr:uncharacterized protein LOC117383558 [Periophthalmus magnuspinnatus]
MTCVPLTKLGFLVILAFIICIPEFFTINRVLRVSLLCGDEDSRDQAGGEWSRSSCGEHWEPIRAAADHRNMTRADKSCFVCRADVSAACLHQNSSSPAHPVSFEMSLNLQQNNTTPPNITLLGWYNHTSLHLHLSHDNDDEEEREKNYESSDGFMYCAALSDTDTANHSCCLLCLSLQIFAREGLPWKRSTKDEWGPVLRVIWFSLLCVVLLVIVTMVTQKITKGRRRRSDKAKIYPLNYTTPEQHLTDEKQQEVNTANALNRRRIFTWSALSSIEEEDTPDESDVFLNDYTCNERTTVAKETHII